ncbi:TolC family protein [Aliamphritea spongicola]|nr:TolC family protein [Aliamphritea spongicola]
MVTNLCRLTLLAGCIQAATVQAGSLADIYQQALQHDPQLKASASSALAGAEAIPQAEAGLRPTISLSANASRNETETRDFNNSGYTVSLSQPIYDSAAWHGVKRGEALSRTAQLQYDQAQQNLIIRSVESYLNVLRAKNTLETTQAEERAIKRRLDQVNAQFDVGLIPVTDVHEAQASYDNAKVARILAEGELDNSFEAIERLSGQSYSDVDTLSAKYPIENLNRTTLTHG